MNELKDFFNDFSKPNPQTTKTTIILDNLKNNAELLMETVKIEERLYRYASDELKIFWNCNWSY